MGHLKTTFTVTYFTYRSIASRPFYYATLALLAAMIVLSKFITLFTFHQEMNMVREMGITTIAFFAFLSTLILSGPLVTRELEEKTTLTLLAKPLSRSSFLVGKFLGLVLAIAPGIFLLCGTLFLTLWWMNASTIFGNDALMWNLAHPPEGHTEFPVMVYKQSFFSELLGCLQAAWTFGWKTNLILISQGGLLSFLQGAILASICISLSAFFPVLISTSTTAVLFIMGNMSGYMVGSVEAWNSPTFSFFAELITHLLPNLGYFNLQTYFNEGRIISNLYLGLTALYAVLYCFAVLLLSCTAFQRREIR
jgi:Cu-processing system permease protein